MPKEDPLLTGIKKALPKDCNIRKMSAKTRYNRMKEGERIIKDLRYLDFGVKRWSNLSNKHVGALVVLWQDERNLMPATIKSYMSAIRYFTQFYGNDRIHADNAAFGIGKRDYISNKDKSVPDDVFQEVVKELKLGMKQYDQYVAAAILLQRHLGLRMEESFKFHPESLLSDGRVFICHGTKGGRERFIHEVTPEGMQAIEYAAKFIKGRSGNLIPEGMTEQQWRKLYYKRLYHLGMNKANAGASSHGNRHAYAQKRYLAMTGFPPPCKFDKVSDFIDNAVSVAGEKWKDLDLDARIVLRAEMGHGAKRNDVVSQYIGSHSHGSGNVTDDSSDAETEFDVKAA